jgi:hypothetical protein
MSPDFQAPTPHLVHVFNMVVDRANAISVGSIATGGRRTYVPVSGGRFEGEGLSGTLVSGGELLLERADGVTMIEASYYIAFPEGTVIRCSGTGYRTSDAGFSGMRLALLFEAPEASSLSELVARAFLAEEPEGTGTMSLSRID